MLFLCFKGLNLSWSPTPYVLFRLALHTNSKLMPNSSDRKCLCYTLNFFDTICKSYNFFLNIFFHTMFCSQNFSFHTLFHTFYLNIFCSHDFYIFFSHSFLCLPCSFTYFSFYIFHYTGGYFPLQSCNKMAKFCPLTGNT